MLVQLIKPAQVGFVCVGIDDLCTCQVDLFFWSQLALDRLRDSLRYLLLQLEHVTHIALISLRPNVPVAAGLD